MPHTNGPHKPLFCMEMATQHPKIRQSSIYTGDWNLFGEWFLAENQGNHQNFDPSLLTNKLWLVFMGMKQKKLLFKEKFQNGRLKRNEILKTANSQYFFSKTSWIGPWVSTIDWCGSTYMVVRLSDISSKTGKKCIFGVLMLFLSLCRTASQPYRLSHTNALRINQFY